MQYFMMVVFAYALWWFPQWLCFSAYVFWWSAQCGGYHRGECDVSGGPGHCMMMILTMVVVSFSVCVLMVCTVWRISSWGVWRRWRAWPLYDDDSHNGGCVFQRMCFDGLHTVEDIIVGSVTSVEGLAIVWWWFSQWWLYLSAYVFWWSAQCGGYHRGECDVGGGPGHCMMMILTMMVVFFSVCAMMVCTLWRISSWGVWRRWRAWPLYDDDSHNDGCVFQRMCFDGLHTVEDIIVESVTSVEGLAIVWWWFSQWWLYLSAYVFWWSAHCGGYHRGECDVGGGPGHCMMMILTMMVVFFSVCVLMVCTLWRISSWRVWCRWRAWPLYDDDSHNGCVFQRMCFDGLHTVEDIIVGSVMSMEGLAIVWWWFSRWWLCFSAYVFWWSAHCGGYHRGECDVDGGPGHCMMMILTMVVVFFSVCVLMVCTLWRISSWGVWRRWRAWPLYDDDSHNGGCIFQRMCFDGLHTVEDIIVESVTSVEGLAIVWWWFSQWWLYLSAYVLWWSAHCGGYHRGECDVDGGPGHCMMMIPTMVVVFFSVCVLMVCTLWRISSWGVWRRWRAWPLYDDDSHNGGCIFQRMCFDGLHTVEDIIVESVMSMEGLAIVWWWFPQWWLCFSAYVFWWSAHCGGYHRGECDVGGGPGHCMMMILTMVVVFFSVCVLMACTLWRISSWGVWRRWRAWPLYDDDSHDDGCVFQRMCFDGLHTVEDIIVGSVMSMEGLAIVWWWFSRWWLCFSAYVFWWSAHCGGYHRGECDVDGGPGHCMMMILTMVVVFFSVCVLMVCTLWRISSWGVWRRWRAWPLYDDDSHNGGCIFQRMCFDGLHTVEDIIVESVTSVEGLAIVWWWFSQWWLYLSAYVLWWSAHCGGYHRGECDVDGGPGHCMMMIPTMVVVFFSVCVLMVCTLWRISSWGVWRRWRAWPLYDDDSHNGGCIFQRMCFDGLHTVEDIIVESVMSMEGLAIVWWWFPQWWLCFSAYVFWWSAHCGGYHRGECDVGGGPGHCMMMILTMVVVFFSVCVLMACTLWRISSWGVWRRWRAWPLYDDDSHNGGCVFQRMCFDGLHTVEDIIVGSVMSMEGLAIVWWWFSQWWLCFSAYVFWWPAHCGGYHRGECDVGGGPGHCMMMILTMVVVFFSVCVLMACTLWRMSSWGVWCRWRAWPLIGWAGTSTGWTAAGRWSRWPGSRGCTEKSSSPRWTTRPTTQSWINHEQSLSILNMGKTYS